jgi:hypothetical protein
MLIMGPLVWLLLVLCGIGSLICFVLVLIQMFNDNQTGLGIACIVLVFVCGIGGLIGFVYGWINSAKWGIQNVMLAWTACIVGGIVLNIIMLVTGAGGMGFPQQVP